MSTSCQQGTSETANGEPLDSVSVAQRTADEQTLEVLNAKREKADREASAAKISLEKAEDTERDANDAAKQADRAYETEKKAQQTREAANEQAEKSDKANSKL